MQLPLKSIRVVLMSGSAPCPRAAFGFFNSKLLGNSKLPRDPTLHYSTIQLHVMFISCLFLPDVKWVVTQKKGGHGTTTVVIFF